MTGKQKQRSSLGGKRLNDAPKCVDISKLTISFQEKHLPISRKSILYNPAVPLDNPTQVSMSHRPISEEKRISCIKIKCMAFIEMIVSRHKLFEIIGDAPKWRIIHIIFTTGDWLLVTGGFLTHKFEPRTGTVHQFSSFIFHLGRHKNY